MTGSYKDTQRPGCPRISTQREDRLLVRQSLQNRRETVPHLRIGWIQNGVQASNSTVQRILKEAGLVAHVAMRKTSFSSSPLQELITIRNGTCRLDWVDGQLCFGVMSQNSLFQNNGRVFVRRSAHEAYRNISVVPTVKFGGGGVQCCT